MLRTAKQISGQREAEGRVMKAGGGDPESFTGLSVLIKSLMRI